MIKCMCAYFNWTNNPLRKTTYNQFRNKFPYPLTTVEISLDNFFIEDSIKILANDSNILWQKERAFNLVLQELPDKYDKILWVDTDVIFLNNNMLYELEDKLDEYDMVQPFESVREYHNGKISDNLVLNTNSYAKSLTDNNYDKTKYEDAACGLTWAINRSIIPHGLYDKHILGSNDMLQVQAVTLDVLNSEFIGKYTNNIVSSWVDYCKEMPLPTEHKYGIGYCSGVVEHIYHGKICNRGYQYRETLLNNYDFNPEQDIEIDSNGLYKILNKDLQQAIKLYFNNRGVALNDSK